MFTPPTPTRQQFRRVGGVYWALGLSGKLI